jgi:hypothetical protein
VDLARRHGELDPLDDEPHAEAVREPVDAQTLPPRLAG